MQTKLEQMFQIDIVLESLSESFNQFKMNYNMNNLDLTPMKLIHELESADQSLIKPNNVHVVVGSSVKPKKKRVGYNKNKKKKVQVLVIKIIAIKKPKCKCFKCGHKGYQKQNCPKATKKPDMSDLNVVKTCLVENCGDKQIIDS